MLVVGQGRIGLGDRRSRGVINMFGVFWIIMKIGRIKLIMNIKKIIFHKSNIKERKGCDKGWRYPLSMKLQKKTTKH